MFDRIVKRIVRIIKLDWTVFAEIEKDETANNDAIVIVVAAAFLAALGGAVHSGQFLGVFLVNLLIGVLVGWLLWSFLTSFIGTKLFGAETNFWEMARCVGYAYAFNAIGILGIFGCVSVVFIIVGWALALVASFFAIREALDLPTDKTIITIVIGWAISLVVTVLVRVILA